MTTSRIDVIICTHNRAEHLSKLLAALARQTMPVASFGILVMDDGSTDNTEAVCRNLAQSLPNLKYEQGRLNQGVAKTRNLGIASSQAPLLIFTDDDCIPREDWVERMAAALDKNPIVAGAIETPTDNFWKLCHNIAQFHPFLASKKTRKTCFIAGANMGFHRQTLESLKGFESERRMAEDMEFILRACRAGFSIAFRSDAVVRHDPPRTGCREILLYALHHAQTTVHLRRTYQNDLGIPAFALSPAFLLLFSPAIAILTTCRIFFTDPVLLRRHPATIPVICALKLAWCIGAFQGLLSRKKT